MENGAPDEMGAMVGPDGNLVVSDAQAQAHRHGHGHGHGHHHRHGILGCCAMLGRAISGPLFKILGLDRFTKGKAMSGMAKAGRGQNPFDLGFVQVSRYPLVIQPESCSTGRRIVPTSGVPGVMSTGRRYMTYPSKVSAGVWLLTTTRSELMIRLASLST